MPKSKKKRSILLILKISLKTAVIFLFFLSLPGLNIYEPPQALSKNENQINLKPPAPIPVNNYVTSLPQVNSQGAIIIDLHSQSVLYEKNADTKFPPASTTKIITALVAYDSYDPDQILEVKTIISEGRVIGLVPEEKISAENLIMGALIHSGNDAAYTLAENYPGGVDKFVEKMNQKVAEYKLINTHFTNPIGFEDPNHYTTARDLGQISRVALNDPKIKKIISTKLTTVADVEYVKFHVLENVNTLLGKIPGVAGVKTGWTQEAGEVLSSLVKRGDHEVLIVLLKSGDRFGETERLINWIFENFTWKEVNSPQ